MSSVANCSVKRQIEKKIMCDRILTSTQCRHSNHLRLQCHVEYGSQHATVLVMRLQSLISKPLRTRRASGPCARWSCGSREPVCEGHASSSKMLRLSGGIDRALVNVLLRWPLRGCCCELDVYKWSVPGGGLRGSQYEEAVIVRVTSL